VHHDLQCSTSSTSSDINNHGKPYPKSHGSWKCSTICNAAPAAAAAAAPAVRPPLTASFARKDQTYSLSTIWQAAAWHSSAAQQELRQALPRH
jgi:hypothetical protein